MTKHPLKRYLQETGETQTAFAERVGVSRVTIHRLMKDEGEFTTGLIKQVCAATNGVVQPADFFPTTAEGAGSIPQKAGESYA